MSRIARIEAFHVAVPVIRTFTFASGTAGAAGSTAPIVFVKVTDDEGRVGWGEGRPMPSWSYETVEGVLSAIRGYLGPAILGLPVTDRWGLHERMRRTIGLGPSTGQPIAKAAVDIAVHDLAARVSGLTLRSFLGGSDEPRCADKESNGSDGGSAGSGGSSAGSPTGSSAGSEGSPAGNSAGSEGSSAGSEGSSAGSCTRSRVALSYTVTGHDPSAVGEEVAAAREAGFEHANYKVGVETATDRLVAAAVRESAGPDAFVWADANQSLTLREARSLAPALEAAGTDVLEQPLPADAWHQMAGLRQSTGLALAVDESSVSPADFFRFAADGLVDYLVVKITRSGGLWPTWQQISVASAAGLDILVSGLTDSMITKMAACQIATVVGFSGPAALNGSQFLDDSELFPAKKQFESCGHLWLGDDPGIGIEPDETTLSQKTVDSCVVERVRQ